MSAPERPKLVISFDDLDDAPPVAPPPPAFPTVDGVARPPTQLGAPPAAGFAIPNTHVRNLVAALAGIVLGFLITEVTGIAGLTAQSQFAANLQAGLWVAVLGFCFAVVFVGWEHIEARSGEGLLLVAKGAGLWGAGLGFVAGFLANQIFHMFAEQAFETGSSAGFYVARILGWAIFGVGMGIATAALARSRQKLLNGALGGLAGGAVGGLVFQFIGENVSSAFVARFFGLVFIAAGIGLAIGLVETLRRQAWFQIVGGGMAGKEFVLYEGETRVGSAPKCDITLIKDPAVAPFHFTISAETAGRRTLTAYQGCTVTINGAPVTQHQLRNGDAIGVGATSIVYAERTTGGQPWT